MGIFDSLPIKILNKSLDGLWTRQQAISDNIANFETPGYKSRVVSFEDQLKTQLESYQGKESDMVERINDIRPVTTTLSDQTFRADGNGVDLEKENLELVRTELNYFTSLQLVSDVFSRLKTAINAGK